MVPSVTTFVDFFSESPPQLALFPERCLRARLNTNQCQKCLESCPFGALSIKNRKIDLDTTLCTGCMSCVAACPQDVLVSGNDVYEMLSSFQPERDVAVSCIRQAQNHPDEITLPCVGIVSKPVLGAIFFSDCRSVTFNLTGCAECCNRSVAKEFLTDHKQVLDELSDICTTKVVVVEEKEQLSKQSMARRSYLSKMLDIAVDVSKKKNLSRQVPPLDKPKSSRRIPFKTQLVKKMLINVHGDAKRKVFGLFGYTLFPNARCNCCPLCKGICPTGAIKIDRTSQGKNFSFAMLDCSGCGLCVEFCKKNALVLKQASLDSPKMTSNFET